MTSKDNWDEFNNEDQQDDQQEKNIDQIILGIITEQVCAKVGPIMSNEYIESAIQRVISEQISKKGIETIIEKAIRELVNKYAEPIVNEMIGRIFGDYIKGKLGIATATTVPVPVPEIGLSKKEPEPVPVVPEPEPVPVVPEPEPVPVPEIKKEVTFPENPVTQVIEERKAEEPVPVQQQEQPIVHADRQKGIRGQRNEWVIVGDFKKTTTIRGKKRCRNCLTYQLGVVSHMCQQYDDGYIHESMDSDLDALQYLIKNYGCEDKNQQSKQHNNCSKFHANTICKFCMQDACSIPREKDENGDEITCPGGSGYLHINSDPDIYEDLIKAWEIAYICQQRQASNAVRRPCFYHLHKKVYGDDKKCNLGRHCAFSHPDINFEIEESDKAIFKKFFEGQHVTKIFDKGATQQVQQSRQQSPRKDRFHADNNNTVRQNSHYNGQQYHNHNQSKQRSRTGDKR